MTTLREDFKEFLREKCYDLSVYKEGGYDNIIADFFISRMRGMIESRSSKLQGIVQRMDAYPHTQAISRAKIEVLDDLLTEIGE